MSGVPPNPDYSNPMHSKAQPVAAGQPAAKEGGGWTTGKVIILCIVVAAIALAIGLGVGLGTKDDDDDDVVVEEERVLRVSASADLSGMTVAQFNTPAVTLSFKQAVAEAADRSTDDVRADPWGEGIAGRDGAGRRKARAQPEGKIAWAG